MKLPEHKIETIQDFPESSGNFLKAKSRKINIKYEDETESEVIMDYAEKKCMDVVCIIPYFKNEYDNQMWVHLISCIRPIIGFRDYSEDKREEENINGWELPAGIIEKDEAYKYGINVAASRELKEELGIYVKPNCFTHLGRALSSSGILAERIYFVTTEADPRYQEEPKTDGSPLEKGSICCRESLNNLLGFIRSGFIIDSKTIIGLYKLNSFLNGKY